MSDILKSIAQFVDVPAGGVAVLPHGLNVKGRPEVPDEVQVNNGAFTVTADDTNVTVTNESAFAASVDVLSEMWHSIPRVFGLQNQDAQDSLPVRPFVPAGSGSVSPSSASSAWAYSAAPVSTSGEVFVSAYGPGGGAIVPADGDYYALWEGEISNSNVNTPSEVGVSVNSDAVIQANSARVSQGNANAPRSYSTSMILPGLSAGDLVNGLFRRGAGSGSCTLLGRNITLIKIN